MRAALLLFGFCFPLAAAAEIYEWTDGSGQVHYADRPPTVQAQVVKGATAPSPDAAAAQRELAEKDLAFKKRKEDAAKAKEKADREAEAARIKQENCARARRNLASLDQPGRTYTTDASGQRNYMSDQQRADARAEAEKIIADSCR